MEKGSVVELRTAARALGDRAPLARIYLAGAMRMVGPSGENILPRFRKTRALLAYLCFAEGAPVTRSSLIELLWALSGDTQARYSLRQALTEVKGTIGRAVPGLIEIERESVRLNTAACWIDVFAGQVNPGRLLEDLHGVTSAFDQWLFIERTRLENQQRSDLEGELDRLVENGAAAKLRIEAARRLVSYDPTHEVAARQLMSAFVEIGDRSQALREYERCRQALKDLSKDLTPSPETMALYESIRLTRRSPLQQRAVGLPSRSEPVLVPAVSAGERGAQPSIAVLPFETFSVVPEHGYAADGVVDDLSEALSRLPNFFVSSRLSTRAFRGQNRAPQEIGDLLGVHYVLSGSMRVIADRLRLSVELTDTRNGTALWSQRLDEKFFDLFEVQDRLVEAIVRRIAPHLHRAELMRSRIKRGDRLDAYDLLLRAIENMHNSSRAVFESSERLFIEALERKPDYATAMAWLARWHVLRVGQGWSPNPAADTARADAFATQGVECDATEPMALAVHGHVASYLHKDFDLAFRRFGAALDINPNSAPAWLWQAAVKSWIGDGPGAIADIMKAKALSPYDPLMYAFSVIEGMAFLADGQYERAVECARRSIQEYKTYTSAHRLLVMSLVLAGQEAEARSHVAPLLELEPELTVGRFRSRYPGSASAHAALYCEALARAGVPA